MKLDENDLMFIKEILDKFPDENVSEESIDKKENIILKLDSLLKEANHHKAAIDMFKNVFEGLKIDLNKHT